MLTLIQWKWRCKKCKLEQTRDLLDLLAFPIVAKKKVGNNFRMKVIDDRAYFLTYTWTERFFHIDDSRERATQDKIGTFLYTFFEVPCTST